MDHSLVDLTSGGADPLFSIRAGWHLSSLKQQMTVDPWSVPFPVTTDKQLWPLIPPVSSDQ